MLWLWVLFGIVACFLIVVLPEIAGGCYVRSQRRRMIFQASYVYNRYPDATQGEAAILRYGALAEFKAYRRAGRQIGTLIALVAITWLAILVEVAGRHLA